MALAFVFEKDGATIQSRTTVEKVNFFKLGPVFSICVIRVKRTLGLQIVKERRRWKRPVKLKSIVRKMVDGESGDRGNAALLVVAE